MHLGIPHWPMVLNAECEFIGVKPDTRETYTEQARCAVAGVVRFLDRLRAMGLYEDSLIVLSSDHGLALPPRGFAGDRTLPGAEPRSVDLSRVAGSAMALLVVKPPHRAGPLQVSNAPTAITDIPATVLDLLGYPSDIFPGTPALKLDDDATRPRTFADYDVWRNQDENPDYFEYLDLFEINGRLLQGDAWAPAETVYAPGHEPERSRGLYGSERNSRGQVFRWSGPRAFFHAPDEAREFALTIRSVAPTPQVVTLHIAGEPVDRLTLSDQNWITVRHPLGPPRPAASPLWVELRVDPPWRPPKGDARLLGVMTRDLEWTR